MEGQDVVDVDGREHHHRDRDVAHARARREGEEFRNADAEHGHHGAHEHVDDHGDEGNQEGKHEDVVRHRGRQDHVRDPVIHARGSAHRADAHRSREEDESVHRNGVPGLRREDLADNREGHNGTNEEGDEADVEASHRLGEPEHDRDRKPEDRALLRGRDGTERLLLHAHLIEVDLHLLLGLEEHEAQEERADRRHEHRDRHVDEPLDEGAAISGIGGDKRVQCGIAREEEHGSWRCCRKDEEADLLLVRFAHLRCIADHEHDSEDHEGAREGMRDQKRQDEGQSEDRDDERLPVTHKLEREPVGDALAEAGVLHRRSNQVGADDHPHLHLRPRGEHGRCIGGAGEYQEREIDGRDIGRLGDACGPPDDGHEGEGKALLSLLADLA